MLRISGFERHLRLSRARTWIARKIGAEGEKIEGGSSITFVTLSSI
jgi:hypothetical protein